MRFSLATKRGADSRRPLSEEIDGMEGFLYSGIALPE